MNKELLDARYIQSPEGVLREKYEWARRMEERSEADAVSYRREAEAFKVVLALLKVAV